MDGRTNGRKDGWTGRRVGRLMSEWIVGWMVRSGEKSTRQSPDYLFNVLEECQGKSDFSVIMLA